MLGDLQMHLPRETSKPLHNGHAMLAHDIVFHKKK